MDDLKPVMRSRVDRQNSIDSDASNDASSISESDNLFNSKSSCKEKFFFHIPNEMLESSESSSGTSSAPASFLSPEKLTSSQPKLVIRSPALPLTSHSAPVSIMATPVATPRTETTREKNTHLSRLNSFKKIGRELSVKLENHLSLISPVKSSTSKSSVHDTQGKNLATNPLANFSEDFLNDLAVKIRALKNNDDFKSKPAYSRNIILNAEILQNLPLNSEFREPAMLKLLLADANERIANEDHAIDIEVDLDDPAVRTYISDAAKGCFMMPWDYEKAESSLKYKEYEDRLKKTFLRDFDHSFLGFKDENGVVNKYKNVKEFINSIQTESDPDLPMIVSNIASQNLGIFLNHGIFIRKDSNGMSQSALKRRDGTPLQPKNSPSASYVFSKNKDGSVLIEYTSLISNKDDPTKVIEAKNLSQLGGWGSNISMKNASLEIKCEIHIKLDGQWTIFNPRLKAKGWG